MRKLEGVALVILGCFLLYIFGVLGAVHARNLINGGENGIFLPFASLGENYPADVFLMFGGMCTTFWGIALLFSSGRTVETRPLDGEGTQSSASGRQTSRIPIAIRTFSPSRLMLLNAVFLIICEWIAYIGARAAADERSVAIFALMACAQIVCGFVLLFMAIKERGRSLPAMIFGGGCYVVGLAVAVFSILWSM
ncbi:MAG: hypothetical protein A2Z34_10265 [Planctomycetes bacterium RBG_16_59_8]|nr:MAG: hypothetical protein A2Z34_10265 [Planctomycetes bacterium RBG_16_59_8]